MIRTSVFGVAATFAIFFCGVPLAQETASFTIPIEDYVTTRQALMLVNDDAMYEMEADLASGNVDIATLPIRASVVSTALKAAVLMFPPETNYILLGNPPNPDISTTAKPEVWSNFPAFYQEIQDAAAIAEEASYAATLEEFAPLVAQLREACTNCHEKYVQY